MPEITSTPATLPVGGLPPEFRSRPPTVGDTVVHLDYGLCRLGRHAAMDLDVGGLQTIELRFAKGKTRHVPLTDAVRIWGYGASLPKSKLDAIGGEDWSARQFGRIREVRASLDRIRLAKQLRLARSDQGIDIDPDVLGRAGEGFAHTLTEDQARTLQDIVTDLQSGVPMNRVLVGDVGCGKTEVAVRAALATALSGARIRFVAPTRVLARQHYLDLKDRAKALGLTCALYSGDVSARDKADIARDETIDIVIGTHGVLSEAFDARAFAFTILDEEQKFGAKLKEKGFDPSAGETGNLLRLSATPIPSTIAEAKVGLVDVSLISTYPTGRGRTQTRTCDNEDAALRALIEAELSRDGQVIVICARISDLKKTRARLSALLPEARIDRIHGRRKAKGNRKTLAAFRDGELDILCATSMLETGINVANANLMLVFGAKRFGLAQLHQLRGRIGRGPKDAVFTMVTGRKPSKSFALRLRTLTQMSERGEGLRLAIADSILRGSGRLCDDAQSGHASAIGIELYEHLLNLADVDASPQALMQAVPKILGQTDWGFDDLHREEALSDIFQTSRLALQDPTKILSETRRRLYLDAIAACARIGAVKVGAGPDGLVFVKADGSSVRIAATSEAVTLLLATQLPSR